MGDRFLLAAVIFIIFVVPGVISIVRPEFTYKTSANFVYPKKPSKAGIKRMKASGYIFVLLGIALVIFSLVGGFKGI